MKKNYETPVAEKVEFCYSNQVVASGAQTGCISQWIFTGEFSCTDGNQHLTWLNNP